ncbi:hypothetical protein [Burkholderia cepacia]|uniref:hypothetical protein n=1 Tax=Burkholderia cepacia TaxID=292 RepID=UPI00158CF044|nr:hypothetical protein [Burkholderia cepacia]
MSKNNDDQNLFNQMNLGGFGGLRRKPQVEKLTAENFNNNLTEAGKDFIKQNKNQQTEISTKDEAIRLLNLSEQYYNYRRNKTLSVQCAAGAIEFVLMTIAKHKFNLNYYIENVDMDEYILTIFKSEIARTLDFMKNYGANATNIFHNSMNENSKPVISRFFNNKQMFNIIHSTESIESFDDIVKMGGMYARYRIAVCFQIYEQKFAKNHFELFLKVFSPENKNEQEKEKIRKENGMHFLNIGTSLGKIAELPNEVVNQKHLDMDFCFHIKMFMMDKLYGVLKSNNKYETDGEKITVDWFNLKAEYNPDQVLIEPIYDYNGETEFYFISPIPDDNWKFPSVFEITAELKKLKENKVLSGEPKTTIFMRALIPDFE